jgi:predicted lipase
MTSRLLNAANLACSSIYTPVAQKDFDKLYRINDTVCGTVLHDGVFYVVFQGTETLSGWMEDFDILPTNVMPFGLLHTGFYRHLPALMSLMKVSIPEDMPIVVTGHSKGAAEAIIFAAMLKLAKHDIQPILFACPNAGQQEFTDWLKVNLPGISFRNASELIDDFGDPVPLVPIYPYTSPYPHTLINAPPEDALAPTSWHQAKLYLAGVCKYATA